MSRPAYSFSIDFLRLAFDVPYVWSVATIRRARTSTIFHSIATTASWRRVNSPHREASFGSPAV